MKTKTIRSIPERSALRVAALVAVLMLGSAAAWSAAPGGGPRGPSAIPRPAMPAPASRPTLPDRASRPEAMRRGSARTVVERTENGMTRNTTITNAQGETRTSTTTVTRDPETGVRSVEIQRTGFDGTTTSISRTIERTDDGIHRTMTVTNPQGETMTRDVTINRDAEGNRVIEGTVTSFDGETRAISRTVDRMPQEAPAGE